MGGTQIHGGGDTEKAQRFLRSGGLQPSLLLADPEFSAAEKRWILEQSAQDLAAELRASEENMTSSQTGISGERLRDVQRALQVLSDCEENPRASGCN